MLASFFDDDPAAWAGVQELGVVRAWMRGESGSGKTTLLFNFACSCAANGGVAYFLCRKERMEASPPKRVLTSMSSRGDGGGGGGGDGGGDDGGDDEATTHLPLWDDDTLDRVRLKYINNHVDVMRFFANTHLLKPVPDLIVVDDFDELFQTVMQPQVPAAVERTCAVMCNGVSFKWKGSATTADAATHVTPHTEFPGPTRAAPPEQSGAPIVQLMVSVRSEALRDLFKRTQRWFPTTIDIRGEKESFAAESRSLHASAAESRVFRAYLYDEPGTEREDGDDVPFARYSVGPGGAATITLL